MAPPYYDQGSFSAALYDLIDGALCPESEPTFYRTMAIGTTTPVLDIGAGTGRLSFSLAEAGHRVIGVELSAAMLDIANRKREAAAPDVRERVTFASGDARRLDLGRTFDLAIAPYRLFNFLLTDDDQSLFLNALHRHLSSSGRAVLDCWGVSNGPKPMRPASPHRRAVVNIEGSRFSVARTFKSEAIDWEAQTAVFTVTYDIMDKAGTILQSRDEDLTLRWMLPEEMKALLQRHGFRVLAELGGFDATPAVEPGDRLWVVKRAD